jgi:ferredoxin
MGSGQEFDMVIQVDQELCAGCGVCIDACSMSAIRLETGKAVIDQALCTKCEACIEICPSGALYTEAAEMQIIPAVRQTALTQVVPSTSLERRTLAPWVGTTLAFLGREVLPRLADAALSALERCLAQPTSSPVNVAWRPMAGVGKRPRRLRRRKRGKFS